MPYNTAHEVRAFAIANIISGFLGANMGYLQGGMTLNAKKTDNASHRICIFTAGAFAPYDHRIRRY